MLILIGGKCYVTRSAATSKVCSFNKKKSIWYFNTFYHIVYKIWKKFCFSNLICYFFALGWRPQYRKLAWVKSLGPSLIRRTPLSGLRKKVARCVWRGVGPPSCIHSYCPPGLSSPNFKITGKVTRIWVGCPREIFLPLSCNYYGYWQHQDSVRYFSKYGIRANSNSYLPYCTGKFINQFGNKSMI